MNYNMDYSEQEQLEWLDYLDYCNEYGCMNCGATVDSDEVVGWHNCIYCDVEGALV